MLAIIDSAKMLPNIAFARRALGAAAYDAR